MSILNPTNTPCWRCGKVAVGWAFIEGRRLCHDGPRSCFSLTFEDEWTLDMVERGYEVLAPKIR
jgi:hypothetical protein